MSTSYKNQEVKVKTKRLCSKKITRIYISRKASLQSHKVGPVGFENRKAVLKARRKTVFDVIFYVAWMAGLPLCPSMLLPSVKRSYKMPYWCILVTIVKTLWIVFECIYNNLLWTSKAIRTCYLTHCVVGYVLTLVFFLRKREIVDSVKGLIYLSRNLKSGNIDSTLRLKIFFFASFAFVSFFFGCMESFFFHSAYESLTGNIRPRVPLMPEDGVLFRAFNWFVIFSVVVSYNMSTVTLYTALFLCGVSYRCSGQLFAGYKKKLREYLSCRPLTPVTFSKGTVMFRNIISGINGMDRAIGSCALFIYIASINSVYNFLSVILSQDGRFRSPIVDTINLLIIISALTMLFYISLSGEKLKAESDLLKLEMLEMSDLAIRHSSSHVDVLKFELLFANIRSKNPLATGFGMFNVTKQVMPTIFGVIVTYFWLFYQIGVTADS